MYPPENTLIQFSRSPADISPVSCLPEILLLSSYTCQFVCRSRGCVDKANLYYIVLLCHSHRDLVYGIIINYVLTLVKTIDMPYVFVCM